MDARAPIAVTEQKPEADAGAPRPRRRGRVILLILLIVAGAIAWRLYTAPSQQNAAAGRFGRDVPTQVVAATVKTGDIHVRLSPPRPATSPPTPTPHTHISGP